MACAIYLRKCQISLAWSLSLPIPTAGSDVGRFKSSKETNERPIFSITHDPAMRRERNRIPLFPECFDISFIVCLIVFTSNPKLQILKWSLLNFWNSTVYHLFYMRLKYVRVFESCINTALYKIFGASQQSGLLKSLCEAWWDKTVDWEKTLCIYWTVLGWLSIF